MIIPRLYVKNQIIGDWFCTRVSGRVAGSFSIGVSAHMKCSWGEGQSATWCIWFRVQGVGLRITSVGIRFGNQGLKFGFRYRAIWYIQVYCLGRKVGYMGASLGPRYIPYTYMDALGRTSYLP